MPIKFSFSSSNQPVFATLIALFPTNSQHLQFSLALPSVHKQDPRILPRVPKQDPRSGDASINPRSSQNCPQFWEKFEDSCYKVLRPIKSWKDAKAKCENDNANVVKITTYNENSFVKNYALSEEMPKIWIGMKEAFHWYDGEDINYADWASGHPEVEESCAWIDTTQGDAEGRWYDVPCKADKFEDVGTVCEKPVSGQASLTKRRKQRWAHGHGARLYVVKKTRSLAKGRLKM